MSGKDRFFDFFGRLSDAKVPELPEDFNQFREQMSVEEQARSFYEQLRKNTRLKGVPESFEQFSVILPGKEQAGKEPTTDFVGNFAGTSGGMGSAERGEVPRNRNKVSSDEENRVVELPEVNVFARRPRNGWEVASERLETGDTGIADAGIRPEDGAKGRTDEETEPEMVYKPQRALEKEAGSVPELEDRTSGMAIEPEWLPKFGMEGLPGRIRRINPEQVEQLAPEISGGQREAEFLPDGVLPGKAAGRIASAGLPKQGGHLSGADGGEMDDRRKQEKLEGNVAGSTGTSGERGEAEALSEGYLPGKTAGTSGLDALLEERRRLLEADGELMKEWKEREKLAQAMAGAGGRLAGDDRFYADNRERYAKAVGKLNELVRAISTHPEMKVRREAWKKRLAERDRIEGEYQKTLKPAVKENVYTFSAAGDYYTPVLSEDAEEHKRLNQARKLREDTLKLLEAPSRFEDSGAWKNWVKGNRDTLTDLDFWTAGITEIGRDLNVQRVYDRALENKDGRELKDFLTPGELALLESYVDFLNAADERADDLALGYEIGKGTPEVVSDILLSLISGNVGKTASGAARRALSNWVKQRLRKSLAKKVAKGLEHLAVEGVRTVAATAADPRTYRTIMRRVVAPKRDDEGNMVLDERGLPVFDGWRDALLDGGRDALAEHWADGAFERSKPLARKYVSGRSGADEVYRALLEAKPERLRGGTWKNLAERVLQDELVAPYVESWYEKGLKALTGKPDELQEFGTVEEQLKFFGTLMPVLLLKGGVKAGSLLKAERRYERSRGQVKELLQGCGLNQQEVAARLTELEGLSAGELADWAAPVVKQAGWIDPEKGKALFQAFGNFALDKAAYHLLSGVEAGQGGKPDAPENGKAERPERMREERMRVPNGGEADRGEVRERQAETVVDVARTDSGEQTKFEQVVGGQVGTPEATGVPGKTVRPESGDFRGKPEEAVRVLVERQEGRVEGVFRRKELGDVDLVWSDSKGDRGLARILEKWEEMTGLDELVNRMTEVIDRGRLVRHGKRRVTIQGDGFEAEIRREGNRGWGVYDFRPARKKDAVSPAAGKGRKSAAGKMADAAEVVTGAVSGVRRDGKKEDGLPVADVPERNGRVKPVGGKEVSGEAEAFLDGLMRDGQAFSWTGLLSRKMNGN